MITTERNKTFIKKNIPYYLTAFVIVFGIKLYYSRADSDTLAWILAPTAGWVGILTGISFENAPGVGYINHSLRFIIAPSCSGVQFMIIAMSTLIFSFIHRMRMRKSAFGWIAFSIGSSYLYTVFVNGFRIVISIYLPQYLAGTLKQNGWLTPERLHTIIGTVVYFTSLVLFYFAAGRVSRKIAGLPDKPPVSRVSISPKTGHSHFPMLRKCTPPLFWYFSIVLGIPLLNRAYQNNIKNFMDYALLLTALCLIILSLFCLGAAIGDRLKKPL